MSEVKTHTVTQEHLQAVHGDMREIAQLWVSGLITDKEIADKFATLSDKFYAYTYTGEIEGLLDPNTGLRYGPNQERQT
jgi:hypothetical protein